MFLSSHILLGVFVTSFIYIVWFIVRWCFIDQTVLFAQKHFYLKKCFMFLSHKYVTKYFLFVLTVLEVLVQW